MSKHGDNLVMIEGILVWNGITNPETVKDGVPLAKPKYSVKLAIKPGTVEAGELETIIQSTLLASKFKGQMPFNGHPVRPVDPSFAEGALVGYSTLSAKTEQGDILQKIYGNDGKPLTPMHFGPMLYPGTIIKILVHSFAYDNKQKGIALGLDGIQIVDSAAPRLPIGSGVSAGEVANIFGANATATATIAPPTPPAPGIVPAPSFLKVMTPAANGITYEAYIAQGWTDELLRANGLLV